jgi:hypothetical protein
MDVYGSRGGEGFPTAAVTDAELRASDDERDAAAARLGEALAEGRLSADEHRERLEAVFAARTRRQLDRLTADLPGDARLAVPHEGSSATIGPDPCMLCLVTAVCPPAGVAWWWLARRRARAVRSGSADRVLAGVGGDRGAEGC